MTYLYLLSLLTLVAYIGYALKVCGLPSSLSDIYYILKDKHRPSCCFSLLWFSVLCFLFPYGLNCLLTVFSFSLSWLVAV